MAKINLLSEDLINKIAAGEVIERPASVVKELIENSLDAKASNIVVEVKNSGKDLIKITDDGEGMDEIDAKNSLIRHATSKISSVEDLFSINYLGFRGEALASISSVSQFSLTSKQEGKLEGYQLIAEGGSIISSGISAAEKGTTIEVKNLFFNTPARKKFLKTDSVELRHIIDVVTNYALLNKKVSFKLLHEGHVLLDSSSFEDQRNNIATIYGSNVAKELLEVNYKNDFVEINGFISKPYLSRNDKNQQVLFVNGRWIKNNELVKSVCQGYHSLLFVNKHPIFILELNLEADKIDVNVHPQKSEIKIEQINEVCLAVSEAVNKTLEENNLIPLVDVEFEPQTLLDLESESSEKISEEITEKVTKKIANGSLDSSSDKPVKYAFDPSFQTSLNVQESSASFSQTLIDEVNLTDSESEELIEESSQVESVIVEETPEITNTIVLEKNINSEIAANNKFPSLKILGQVHKTFFVAETEGGVFFIDQHAAHERVMYEQFMNQLMDKKVETQVLLQAEMVEFTASEKLLIDENLSELESFGYLLEPFGGNTYLLKTVPLLFKRLQSKESLRELVSVLFERRNTLLELKEVIITRMSCRSAVMAGEVLNSEQMKEIINKLSLTKFPYTCPHGRPTMIKTNSEELEKKFKRKG